MLPIRTVLCPQGTRDDRGHRHSQVQVERHRSVSPDLFADPDLPERDQTAPFAPLRASSTALLTSFRPNGEGVPTPVSIALKGDRAYFVTAADSGKAKRLARDPTVTLAPCTTKGKVLGATVRGRARLLEGQERRRLRRLLHPTRSLFWSLLLYKLQGKTMNLYEVSPTEQGEGVAT